ncbi:chaperone modulator CbpM [Frankia sp. CiP1_Cm_nod2]|uniref:chaperone modulator CbpM n=1 Tax=Frankia sp. CiP1_Cm_nod2 TaxID=2897161 RepID=UPI002024758A
MTTLLVRASARTQGLDLDAFCVAAHLHPDLVRRLVTLGLLDAEIDPAGHYTLAVTAVARAGRIERLRRDLGITYTATGVVLDLLDRIDELERLLRARPARGEVHPWT